MFNKKEITTILLISLILAFIAGLLESIESFLYLFVSFIIIIFSNNLIKKIISSELNAKIQIKLWELENSGVFHITPFRAFTSTKHPDTKFAKPFQIGLLLPLISKLFLFPLKNFVWMASLAFDIQPKEYSAAKKYKYRAWSFAEIPEYHLGLIAAGGILANLVLALIGYLTNFPEFAKLNIYYAFFNLIPFSELDGNKIFFGSLLIWSILATITLIGLAAIIFVV